MIKNKIGTGALILAAMLLVGMALIPAVSAQQEDSFSEDEYNLPDYGPSIFADLKDDSDVIETRGVIPEITEDKEKVEWLGILEKCIRSSTDELEPYMKEYGGPLIGFGIDYNGYLFVEFDKELESTIDKSTIDELYYIMENDAKKMEVSDIPVVFTEATIVSTSRTSRWTPLIGGIQIVRFIDTPSTLSFAAQDSSGTKGFVMSGHAADNAGGIGASIYQPNLLRKVGEVAYYNGVFADAAWVETSNVDDDIYYGDTDITRDVSDHGDANNGSKVYKSGIATGTTYGYIDRKYINVASNTFGTLYDQYRANYTSDGGDSGSPVFINSGSSVKLVGVHWGRNSDIGKSYFSPISGVISDLGVTPLY